MKIPSLSKIIRIALLGILLASAFSGLAPTNARAALGTVRYASPTGLTSGNCDSWANACTLMFALSKAGTNDQIWVKAGTHRPHATDRTKSFALKNGIGIYGGFAGTETALNQRNITANLTILSGDIGAPNVHTDNSYHVVVASGTASSAKLDGVRIIRGRANGNGTNSNGAGIYNDSGSPTIKNVTFMFNVAAQNGGGMYNLNGAPLVSLSTFSSNTATLNGGGVYNENGLGSFTTSTFTSNSSEFGGGMYNTASKPAIKDLIFSGNSAGNGGGMSNNASSNVAVSNVTFMNNTATNGGGMHNSSSLPTFVNMTFNNNSADNGGGMLNDTSDASLTNVTFSGNAATTNGGGMFNFNSNMSMVNVILWDDTSAGAAEFYSADSAHNIKFSVIEGGCPAEASCRDIINADPQLLELINNGGFTPTMALGVGSSALNTGASGSFCGSEDQRGLLRPQGGVCEIGAYEVEAPPGVFTITIGEVNPTHADSVVFFVNFSEPVQNVGPEDFSLTKTGTISGESATSVSGSGARYEVTANTGTGSGNLRLDVPNAATIQDMAGNPLTNLPYLAGEEYTIDRDAPTVVSIVRTNPNPTSALSASFTVTFSEPVQSVGAADFVLTKTGNITGEFIDKVSGSGTVYDVFINLGTGNGTLRLDIPSAATIMDMVKNPLGGLPFVSGETYTVEKSLLARSLGAEDGWVLESGENTSVGGTLDDAATTLRIGDDTAKKQYRSILSFDTPSLPDDAVITNVTLKLKQQGIIGGGDPVTAFQGFMLDIRRGILGTSSLQLGDWQAATSGTVGPFTPSLSNGFYIFDLTASQSLINKLATGGGRTQIRVRFKVADDNNAVDNFLSIFSGNAAVSNRPLLIVEFHTP